MTRKARVRGTADTAETNEVTTEPENQNPTSKRDTDLGAFLKFGDIVLLTDLEKKDINFLKDTMFSVNQSLLVVMSSLSKAEATEAAARGEVMTWRCVLQSLFAKERYLLKLMEPFTSAQQEGSEKPVENTDLFENNLGSD